MATPATANLNGLGSLAAEHAAEGDAERRLAKPVIDALREAGLFGALVPAALGGLESELQDFLDTVRIRSAHDHLVRSCFREPDAVGRKAPEFKEHGREASTLGLSERLSALELGGRLTVIQVARESTS